MGGWLDGFQSRDCIVWVVKFPNPIAHPIRFRIFAVFLNTSYSIVLLHEDTGAIYTEFMGIVLNVITYNSAYLDSDVICSLVSFISHICVITNWPANVALCLQCLDAIICYSYIPKGAPIFSLSKSNTVKHQNPNVRNPNTPKLDAIASRSLHDLHQKLCHSTSSLL